MKRILYDHLVRVIVHLAWKSPKITEEYSSVALSMTVFSVYMTNRQRAKWNIFVNSASNLQTRLNFSWLELELTFFSPVTRTRAPI